MGLEILECNRLICGGSSELRGVELWYCIADRDRRILSGECPVDPYLVRHETPGHCVVYRTAKGQEGHISYLYGRR